MFEHFPRLCMKGLNRILTITAQNMKFPIKDFFSKCDQICADLVTFTGKTLNGKLHILCSEHRGRV